MKKFIILSLIFSLSLSITTSVYAQGANNPGQTKKQEKMQMNASGSADRNSRVTLSNADLVEVNEGSLTVSKDGTTYTVLVDAKTKILRHHGGGSLLTEFSVGNKLDIRGTFTDAAKTTITAKSIRNRSITKYHGVFIGEILSIDESAFVLRTRNRGDQKVNVVLTTKYVSRDQKPLTLSDLKVGHRVRVKGMWDKSQSTVTQVTQVKDFSLPPKKNASASASPEAEAEQ